MQPIRDEEAEGRDGVLIVQNLGVTIGHSMRATVDEPLPAEMGLLLLRLALAEILKDAVAQEMREAESESLPLEWARTIQRSLELDPRLSTWRCPPRLAAG